MILILILIVDVTLIGSTAVQHPVLVWVRYGVQKKG